MFAAVLRMWYVCVNSNPVENADRTTTTPQQHTNETDISYLANCILAFYDHVSLTKTNLFSGQLYKMLLKVGVRFDWIYLEKWTAALLMYDDEANRHWFEIHDALRRNIVIFGIYRRHAAPYRVYRTVNNIGHLDTNTVAEGSRRPVSGEWPTCSLPNSDASHLLI